MLLTLTKISAQTDNPYVAYDVPSHNLLKFNRFLINPTFSTVRENKSYINVFHRKQSATFDENNQTYFLSYSGRINDRIGLGLGLYSQQSGAITNYGVLANYAYGVKFSEISNFTFGANLSYYRSGYDTSRGTTVDPNDPLLNGLQDSNLLSFQPGFNISYGNFDFGAFAEDLFDYNLNTNTSITQFGNKTFSSHLQYTHEFKKESGILEAGRLMPLLRITKKGEKYSGADKETIMGGSLILDLPKMGWLQVGYNSFYGASAGIGLNFSKRLSLGYAVEKGLSNMFNNFRVTHEISLAFSITPNLTEDRVMLEEINNFTSTDNAPLEGQGLTSKDNQIEDLKKALAENEKIFEELIFRQDSIEASRNSDLEKRFDMVMRMVRKETNGENYQLEEKAKQLYLLNNIKENKDKDLTSNTISTKKDLTDTELSQSHKTTYPPINRTNTDQHQNAIAQDPKESTLTIKPLAATTEKDSSTRVSKKTNAKSYALRGVDDGYYVVANVYKSDYYLNKFIADLKARGIDADYFENKKNGLKYVYLKHHDSWEDALSFYKSKKADNYSADLWIMHVDNTPNPNTTYAGNSKKIKEKSTAYNPYILQKNIITKDTISAQDLFITNSNIPSLDEGYYLIAKVFKSSTNANKFVEFLNGQGLNASYFIHPENNYHYVYLKKYNSWNNALISYYSNLNNAYNEKMWILRIKSKILA